MARELTQPQGPDACLMCGTPLSYLLRVKNERFCGERCRGKYATLPPHEICAGCGRPLSPHQFGNRVCASVECLHRAEALKRERELQRREALRVLAAKLRDREATAPGLPEPESYRPTVLPSVRARIRNLPERRRRAFRDAVNRLISAASERPPGGARPPAAAPTTSAAPTPEVQAVLGQACALCRGYCCGNGGNHAYLTVDTIRRYMAQHPDQRPRDVLAAYLDRIGNKTFEGSCVFHGTGGCGLSRDMRSDTCNRHYCTGLKQFQEGLTGGEPARGFFVATEGDTILAAAFVDAGGSRPVPLSPDNGQGP